MQQLKDAIIEYVVTECGVPSEEIDEERGLFSEGLIDSLNVMDLVVLIESQINRKIPVTDITFDNLDSIKLIMDYIERK